MSRIDELLSNIELSDYDNSLTEQEHSRIMDIINVKLNNEMPSQRKHCKRKHIKKLLIAAVLFIITSGSVFAIKSYLDGNLADVLGISQEQQEQFENAVDTPLCSVTENGITVEVLQTLSDTRTIFTIFTVTTADDIMFGDDYFFYKPQFVPEDIEKYGSFQYDIKLLNETGNVKKYLGCMFGVSENFDSGKLKLSLGNLCKYIRDEDGDKLKDSHGIEMTEDVIAGSWDLVWEYDSSIRTDIQELTPSIDIPLSSSVDGEKSITVKKITLSPLSVAIDYATDADYVNDKVGNAYISVNFKDGRVFDMPQKAFRSFDHDTKTGLYYYRFDSVENVENIESITIDDNVIPVDNALHEE